MGHTITLVLVATKEALRFSLRKDSSARKSAGAISARSTVLARGGFYRLGTRAAYFEITTDDEPYSESVTYDHRTALRSLIDYLHRNSIITALSDITLVVHRIPSGGVLIRSAQVLEREDVHQLSLVRNLHIDNAAAFATARAALQQLPAIHVAVADTALFTSLPPEAARYALPTSLVRRFHVHRFGSRGIAHRAAYTAAMAALSGMGGARKQSSRGQHRVVSVNIDEDVTVTALLDGVALDTSAGFTAAEGLPGLHRSGSLDPRIPLHLAAHLGSRPEQVDTILSGRSGIAAMCGKGTYAEILDGARTGEAACASALMLLSYRIAREVAAVATAALGGIDLLIFSGPGASWAVREEACRRLGALGVRVDGTKQPVGVVSARGSKVLVVAVGLIDDEEALLREGLGAYTAHVGAGAARGPGALTGRSRNQTRSRTRKDARKHTSSSRRSYKSAKRTAKRT